MKSMNTKNLLVAGMAATVLVAPVSTLAAEEVKIENTAVNEVEAINEKVEAIKDVGVTTEKVETDTKEKFYVEMLNQAGDKTFVHVDFVEEYMLKQGYSLTEEGKKQLGEEEGEKAEDAFFAAIQMETPNGLIRYVHSDFVDEYMTERGYILTEIGKEDLAALDKKKEEDSKGDQEVEKPVEKPEGEKPAEKPEGEKPDNEKPNVDEDQKGDYGPPGVPKDELDFGGGVDISGGEKDPNTDKDTDKDPEKKGELKSKEIKDLKLTMGSKDVIIDLDDYYFTNTAGATVSYSVEIKNSGGKNVTVDGDKVIISTSKAELASTSTITVVANDGTNKAEQEFKVTITKDGTTLPQTGSTTSGAAGALGALLIAAGAAIGLRRKS